MNKIKHTLIKVGLLVLSSTFILTSCDKDDDNTDPVITESLDDIISSRTDLTIFKAALERTRLNSFTKGGGPFTIWAPLDAAFNASGISSASDINLIDSNLLVQILTYHIQAANRSYFEIPLGPNANMVTQGGLTQYASRKLAPLAEKAYINGVEVTEPNIRASNGYIHVLNGVLLPPLLTTAQTLAANPNYARFYQAILKTSTTTTTNPLTIFAVNNADMIAAGYDSTTIANVSGASLTALTAVVRYHFVSRRIFSSDFATGNLRTVQTSNLVIGGGIGSFTVKGTNNPGPFAINGTNIITTTGVIQNIEGVLKP